MKRTYARRLVEHVYMARFHIISHVFGQPLAWNDGFAVRAYNGARGGGKSFLMGKTYKQLYEEMLKRGAK